MYSHQPRVLDLTDPGYLRGLYRALADADSSMTITTEEQTWIQTELPRIHARKMWETSQMIGYDYGRIAGEHLATRRGDREPSWTEWSIHERNTIHPQDLDYLCPTCASDLDYNPDTRTWICSGTTTTTELIF